MISRDIDKSEKEREKREREGKVGVNAWTSLTTYFAYIILEYKHT